jgi:hypothetical protein
MKKTNPSSILYYDMGTKKGLVEVDPQIPAEGYCFNGVLQGKEKEMSTPNCCPPHFGSDWVTVGQLRKWLANVPDEFLVVLGCEAECCMEELHSMRVENNRVILSLMDRVRS